VAVQDDTVAVQDDTVAVQDDSWPFRVTCWPLRVNMVADHGETRERYHLRRTRVAAVITEGGVRTVQPIGLNP